MAQRVTLQASDGSSVEFLDEIKAQGGVKDVYFSPDKTYVVAFYRKPLGPNDKERINNIVGVYRERIFNGPCGDYWKPLFAWPAFLTTLHLCIKIARAVRRLHAAGLAHSDLSYKNILVDPVTGSACIIDADSLVVPVVSN